MYSAKYSNGIKHIKIQSGVIIVSNFRLFNMKTFIIMNKPYGPNITTYIEFVLCSKLSLLIMKSLTQFVPLNVQNTRI